MLIFHIVIESQILIAFHFCMYKSGGRRQDDADIEVADSSEVDVSPTGHITLVVISFIYFIS